MCMLFHEYIFWEKNLYMCMFHGFFLGGKEPVQGYVVSWIYFWGKEPVHVYVVSWIYFQAKEPVHMYVVSCRESLSLIHI